MPVVLYDVNWVLDEDVPAATENNLWVAAEIMHDYAVSMGMPKIDDVSVYYIRNFDDLVEEYSRVSGFSESFSRDLWSSALGVFNFYNNFVFINGSQTVISQQPVLQTEVLAHEISHAQRHGLYNLLITWDDYGVINSGPVWLDEGIAYFHQYKTSSTAGFFTYNHRRRSILEVIDFYGSLRDMENREGFKSVENNFNYPFFAAELLASIAGESSLYEFYAALHPETTWQAEFKNTFGLSVGEFYDLFEQHEAAGFPKLDIPKFVER